MKESSDDNVPLDETKGAIACMWKGGLEATEFGSWKYMKDSNTIQNRWRYTLTKEVVAQDA